MTKNKKISVFALWRDSQKTIHETLKQLEDIESLSGFDFSYYFYENDSKDNTASILEAWMEKREGFVKSEILGAKKYGSTTDPSRMKFLCDCRNKCKDLAQKNNSDYSLLIDSDIKFDKENFTLQLYDLENLDQAVMITPNTRQNISDLTFGCSSDSYYDVYAFRDRHGTSGVYFSDCPSYKRDDQFNWKIGIPILTMSSFGGFAIVKSEVFNKVKWYADIHCDHVNMCFDISRYGNIYCDPRSKVYVNVDLSKINLEACANIAKTQKEKYYNNF